MVKPQSSVHKLLGARMSHSQLCQHSGQAVGIMGRVLRLPLYSTFKIAKMATSTTVFNSQNPLLAFQILGQQILGDLM